MHILIWNFPKFTTFPPFSYFPNFAIYFQIDLYHLSIHIDIRRRRRRWWSVEVYYIFIYWLSILECFNNCFIKTHKQNKYDISAIFCILSLVTKLCTNSAINKQKQNTIKYIHQVIGYNSIDNHLICPWVRCMLSLFLFFIHLFLSFIYIEISRKCQ